ncbi:MAG: hypothetical protein GY795_13590, partial [Desulfobacterales bacterium]|nr:hypothetical protein [Desulfobacterales bacterium]
MKKLLTQMFLYLVIFSLCLSAVQPAHTAPVQFKDHLYEVFIDTEVSWHQAKAIAEDMGGYLATITSADEQQFIEDLLISSGVPSAAYWFGLVEAGTEGIYTWDNGESLSSYTNWNDGEPSNAPGDESVGHIYWTVEPDAPYNAFSHRGKWNDLRPEGWEGLVYRELNRGGYIVESDQCEYEWNENQLVADHNESSGLKSLVLNGDIIAIKLTGGQESLILRKKIFQLQFPTHIMWTIKASEYDIPHHYFPSVNIVLDPPSLTSNWWNNFMGGITYHTNTYNDGISGIVSHFSSNPDWRRFGVDTNVEGENLLSSAFSWYPESDKWVDVKIIIYEDKTEFWADGECRATYDYDFTKHETFAWGFGDQNATLVELDKICVSPGIIPSECDEDDSGSIDIAGKSGPCGGKLTIPVRIQDAPATANSIGFDVAFDSGVLIYTGFARGELAEPFDFFN